MTEVLPSGIRRSYTAPASSAGCEAKHDTRVLDWQFNVARSNRSETGSAKSTASFHTAPPTGSRPSLPHSKAYVERSAAAKTRVSSQEQFKQVPSLHASRKHEDYEFDYDGHIMPPLGVSRITRRETTTTTCGGFESGTNFCANNERVTAASKTQVHVENVQQTKKEEGSGISGGNVMSALLGAAAGAAVAYAMFNKFAGEKEEKTIEKEEPIRMVSRSPSVSGNKMGPPERAYSLGVIDEDRRADYETFRPEARLAIMPASFDENVWADDKQTKVSRSSGKRSMDVETLVGEDEYRSVVGSVAQRSRRAPESYVSARSYIPAGSPRSNSWKKNLPGDDQDSDSASDSESSESDSDSEQDISDSEHVIDARKGSYNSAKGVPLSESVASRHSDRRSHTSSQEIPKADSVVSHRSRRSHGSRRHDEDYSKDDGRESRSGRKSRKSSVAGTRDVAKSEVSHGSQGSKRSHRGDNDHREKERIRDRSKESRRSSKRRTHTSRRESRHDDHQQRDPHQLFRETEHSTDASIGANFASRIAAIARKKLGKHGSGSHVSAREVPLPDSDARSCVTAREIPLPESELGGAHVKGGVYGGGGLGLGLGNRLSARFVELPESDVASVVPEDSISNVGGRRHRRR